MTDLALALLGFGAALAGLGYPAYVARLVWFELRSW